ncbi:unnamed protein product [Protopolystoma xenopodis]|uniref:Cornichon n=1 Tax=Protopolystoma xenopodis TaxID=117903 RepID=A0A3S5C6B1_9PLAT|nr:unnamed protein product [Protopolystoma xenopodis]
MSISNKRIDMAFGLIAVVNIIALILCIGLIFLTIYHIIAFEELKTDYKNPVDQCRSLNPLVIPEYSIHGFFTLLFLLTGQLWTVLFNIPLIAYNINRYLNRPLISGRGLYDPTTIMNNDELSRAMKEGWIKIVFYVLSFFYYLYG